MKTLCTPGSSSHRPANAAVVAVRLMRGMEKLDAALARRAVRHAAGGLLLLAITSALLTVGMCRIVRARREADASTTVTSSVQPATFVDVAPAVTLGVTAVGLGLAGLCRLQSMTLSQTVDEVLAGGFRDAGGEGEGLLAAVVVVPLMIAAACGGWFVWEGLALARARRRCSSVDSARLAHLLISLRDEPSGVGTKLIFKPREPKGQVRQLIAFTILHELAQFDSKSMWLTRRGNDLIARAA